MSYYAAWVIIPAWAAWVIMGYHGFSPCRSCEVDRVYLTFLFKATFQFNCIISLIFILVFCRLSIH